MKRAKALALSDQVWATIRQNKGDLRRIASEQRGYPQSGRDTVLIQQALLMVLAELAFRASDAEA